LQKVLRQWSDRKKWLEEPVFKSYVFVRIFKKEQLKVLELQGVLAFVRQEGLPVPVKEEEIDRIKKILSGDHHFTLHNDAFVEGEYIEVISGALAGLKGLISEKYGKKKLVVSIDVIGYQFVIDLGNTEVKKYKKK
jgi:transcriptional antiterminator RfaH